MAFGLVIGTDRASALQNVIQEELSKRGFSADPDPVMAEYITIMLINNKTPAQITAELEDLIGSDYDSNFTDWLFVEAAKGPEAEVAPQASNSAQPAEQPSSPKDTPVTPVAATAGETSRRVSQAPRNGVYQQALNQALPSSATAGHKRTASARSPSPSHPSKSRRTDVPTGPRAMQRDGQPVQGQSRSLADRIGGPAMRNNHRHDDIQNRIDDIVNGSNNADMMMSGGFNGGMGGMPAGMGGGMDMGMANPMMLQEMMMNSMALMAQMATSMGMMNPAAAQYGMPMQGMPGVDMGMYPGGNMGGFQGHQPPNGHAASSGERGRGRGGARGRIGHPSSDAQPPADTDGTTPESPITAPTPTIAAPVPVAATPAQPQRIPYSLPERPQTPSLCKFGVKCTNAHCRYSHPSPVATAESGVVLSSDPCENGKDCQDKDCIKSHVSPAVLNPAAAEQPPPAAASPVVAPPPARHPHTPSNAIPCRFGAQCTRPNCAFSHPPRPSTVQCRFGTACTRATCPYQHPEGRVLPTSFHRGLSTSAPMVTVQTPETGSMGGPSPHKSVKFNNLSAASVKERLKQIEEQKLQAEKAVKEAEAAAAGAGKKDDSKPVAIAAA